MGCLIACLKNCRVVREIGNRTSHHALQARLNNMICYDVVVFVGGGGGMAGVMVTFFVVMVGGGAGVTVGV